LAADELTWIGKGFRFIVHGVTLDNPMTYFWGDRPTRPPIDEPSALQIAMPIATTTSESSAGLPYWPRYDRLSPLQRAEYLRWMADGRRTLPPEPGYLFIFFYGLERRALVESSDLKLVWDEVARLRRLHAEGEGPTTRSFEHYSAGLLWFLAVRHPQTFALKRVQPLLESTANWDEDTLAAMLAWFHRTHGLLPGWAAFALAGQLQQSQRSVVVQRVPDQFRSLFVKRFEARFPHGMALQTPKRDRRHVYRPASAVLPPVEHPAAHPMGMPSQFRVLSEIWNDCVVELRKLSAVLAKQGEDGPQQVTLEQWEAMPAEIRAGVDHPLADKLCRVADDHTDSTGRTQVPITGLAAAIGIAPGEEGSLTVAQSRRLCKVAEDVGYCLEPDARLVGRAYRAGEQVGMFLKLSPEPSDPARYNAAASVLQFGLSLAAADGDVHDAELAAVNAHITETFRLNEEEHRRLDVIRAFALAHPPEQVSAKRLFRDLAPEQRHAIAKLVLFMVAADGVVTKEELKAVRKTCAALGYAKDEIEGFIRSLQSKADEAPVPVVQPYDVRRPGEAIPSPPPTTPAGVRPQPAAPDETVAFRLNREAIASILKDTEEVARLLADAMSVEDSDKGSSAPAPPESQRWELRSPDAARQRPLFGAPEPARVQKPEAADVIVTADPSLPQRYASLYQLLVARGEWALAEAEALARAQGHMLSGAVEALNDWAFEKHGSQLFVEDGDKLVVERQLLN
jgi:uncharacterized tellurite resistance protein B-like protein